MDKLDKKFEFYKSLLPKVTDENGFVFSDECDSLAFTSLMCSVPGIDFKVESALDKKTGMWHRRSCDKPCYPDHSKSTISRDMLLMLLVYCYSKGRLDLIEQVIKYALSNWMIMGKGVISRTFMTPGLLSTYAWASYRLGGPSRPWLRMIPQFESSSVEDYQAHLSVVHIMLRNHLTGKKKNIDKIKKHASRNPDNAFYHYLAGDKEKALSILANEKLFPSNRLPNKLDRKAEYLWQRELLDYIPGDSNKELAPADFLFVYGLIKYNLFE